jgi:hypothetical protein
MVASLGMGDLLVSRPQHCVTHSRPFSLRCRYKNRSRALRVAAEDSGGSFPENIINQISVAVANFSPANAVKKAIAAAQAGQYDEAEISGKVDAYIRENPVRGGPYFACGLLFFRQIVHWIWGKIKVSVDPHLDLPKTGQFFFCRL